MWNTILGLCSPLLLVFGLYHLMTWFNILRINHRDYWKRVALVSAIAHMLLATGFFVFTYLEYRANRDISGVTSGFGSYLFDRSQFWPMLAIFDTLPMAILVGLFLLLDRIGFAPPGLLALTIVITYVVGSVEWYFVGGAAGALLSRFWDGLKTDDDDDWGN